MGSVAESAQSKGSADSYEFCECAQCTEWISKYHVLQQEVRSRRFPPCLSCMLLAKSIYGVAVEMVRSLLSLTCEFGVGSWTGSSRGTHRRT